jgi:hypothetical protein
VQQSQSRALYRARRYAAIAAGLVFALTHAWVMRHPHSQWLYGVVGPLVGAVFAVLALQQGCQSP